MCGICMCRKLSPLFLEVAFDVDRCCSKNKQCKNSTIPN